MYHVRFFIVKKMGFREAPRRHGIHSKTQPSLQKTCLSYASKTLATYTGVRTYVIHLLGTYLKNDTNWMIIYRRLMRVLCLISF